MYHQVNIHNSTFCPHSVFMCFVWIWEQTVIISLHSINWLFCITETECVYCAVRTGYLYIILRSVHTAVFMCFVWIWEQTAIISLYSINWLVCITETESVYCTVRTGYLSMIQVNRSPMHFLIQCPMFTFSTACVYLKGERAHLQISHCSIILVPLC